MEFSLVVCSEGEKWFPWNYGRKSLKGRVGMETAEAQTGLRIINAVSPTGRILGSCSFRVGYRHSDYLMADEEFQYGALGASSLAYFWPEDDSPWIMTLKSFWVRPEARREGVARAFAEYARNLGFPAYLAFANKAVEEWFNGEFQPTQKRSRLQKKVDIVTREPEEDVPERDADFTVHFQAEASAFNVWESFQEGSRELAMLFDCLFFPDRMDHFDADEGGCYEVGFSDSAFAADRSFGCVLFPGAQEWGPEEGLYELGIDDDYEAAEEAYAKQSRFAAGLVEGWIIDSDIVLAYASIRHFLRTLEWQDFTSVNEALEELYVRDLKEQPRGLRRFDAMVSPLNEHNGTTDPDSRGSETSD